MSTQTELRTIVSAELADLLEAYFYETETTYWGVMQRERDDPYEVFGFFPDDKTAENELTELRRAFPKLPGEFVCSTIRDEDWKNAYKEFVKPWSDRQLHWIPLWERANISPPEGAATIYLDAGMAFGTGAHETTRLCARRLLDYLEKTADRLEEVQVIDAGCGSGVLTFSAAALGLKQVYGFDFDPEAIRVCHENIDYNSHIPPVEFEVANLEKGLNGRQADLLLANIQTDVLIPESDHIVQAVKAGGTLALSGILVQELEEVRAHYENRFMELRGVTTRVDSRKDGEWGDLLFELS
ncbi:MAG: 50S ribosomal protein L11 methyltransferase [Verrucomicrobiota bacterium]